MPIGLAGFDFEALNQRFIARPENLAGSYGVQILKTTAIYAPRCIGVYHLPPHENRGRNNIFLDVLDKNGHRYRDTYIYWRWQNAPDRRLNLTKPDSEPAADIPLSRGMVVTLQVTNGLSDVVSGLTSNHPDEGDTGWNTWHHHSFYVVFQYRRQDEVVIQPDPPDEELTLQSLAQEVAILKRRMDAWEGDGR